MTDTQEPEENNLDEATKAQDEKVKEHSVNLGKQLKQVLKDALAFLKELMSIRSETDYKQTRDGIERDVTFRGHTVYILICSIFIASIGLNLNSPAVIIGAMLIAPLMGPILGIGLSLGTNDSVLLIKSLKNFGVMVFISLATSSVYFWLTPLVEYQPELMARTKPTTLDIFVAIFGGIAGIVAGSRKEKSNVVSGVAIATALMPPLCTAGFGLATMNMAYFFGAFYLFMLNSIFICAATLVGVRYLRFPLKLYVNPRKERRVKIFMLTFVLIMVLPSAWIFWGILKESNFNSKADKFVVENINMLGSKMVNQKILFNDTLPLIEVYMIGEEVPADTIEKWRSKLAAYGLEGAEFQVYGSGNAKMIGDDMDEMEGRLQARLREDVLEDLYTKNNELIKNKDERIELLENRLFEYSESEVKVVDISNELKIQFEDLLRISYAKSLESDFTGKIDTIPTFLVQWNKKASKKERLKNEETIGKLMQLRLKLDTVRVIPIK